MSTDPNVLVLHEDHLKTLLAEAAEAGADKALAKVGLGDKNALADMTILRSVAGGIREAKTEVWRTIGRQLLRLMITGLLFAAAVKLFGPQIAASWVGKALAP